MKSAGIGVQRDKFYLVNLNADPIMSELLVCYLKVSVCLSVCMSVCLCTCVCLCVFVNLSTVKHTNTLRVVILLATYKDWST